MIIRPQPYIGSTTLSLFVMWRLQKSLRAHITSLSVNSLAYRARAACVFTIPPKYFALTRGDDTRQALHCLVLPHSIYRVTLHK